MSDIATLNQEIARALSHVMLGSTGTPMVAGNREYRHWGLDTQINHPLSERAQSLLVNNQASHINYWLREDGEIIRTVLVLNRHQTLYEVIPQASFSPSTISQIIIGLKKL